MELGELKVFVTVAAEHSFSRAAIKLCRTQPAVSQAIRRLEEDLGELVFDRSTKSVKLTQAGDVLLPEAIRLLRIADEAVATVRQLSQRDRAVLRIGGDEPDAHILLTGVSTLLLPQAHPLRGVVDTPPPAAAPQRRISARGRAGGLRGSRSADHRHWHHDQGACARAV